MCCVCRFEPLACNPAVAVGIWTQSHASAFALACTETRMHDQLAATGRGFFLVIANPAVKSSFIAETTATPLSSEHSIADVGKLLAYVFRLTCVSCTSGPLHRVPRCLALLVVVVRKTAALVRCPRHRGSREESTLFDIEVSRLTRLSVQSPTPRH